MTLGIALGGGGFSTSSEALASGDAGAAVRAFLFGAAADNLAAWVDSARAAGRRMFWYFHGWAGPDAGSLEEILWGSNFIDHPTEGFVDGRILELSEIERGLPAGDDLPERVSVSMTLRRDEDLGPLLVGTTQNDTTQEYLGASIFNLYGKVYLAVVAPDGSLESRPITPTLYVSEDPEVSDTTVRVSLSSVDSSIFGSSRFADVTIGDVTAATYVQGFTLDDAGTSDPAEVVYTEAEWIFHRERMSHNADRVVPWAYGRTPLPLVPMTEPDSADTYFCGFFSETKPDLTTFCGGGKGDGPHARNLVIGENGKPLFFVRDIDHPIDQIPEINAATLWHSAYTVWISLTLSNGETTRVWFTWFYFWTNHRVDEWILYPAADMRLSESATATRSPVSLISQIVDTHAQTAAARASVDATSFDRAEAIYRGRDAFAGVIGDSTTIGEAASHLAQPLQLDLWVDVDDLIHVQPRVEWIEEFADLFDTGDLPRIFADEIEEESYREIIPTGEGSRGAPATRIALEYDTMQRQFFSGRYRPIERVSGATPLPVGPRQIEAVVSAKWVDPRRAPSVFQAAAGLRSQVWRRIKFTTAMWIAAYPLGQFFLLSYPLGLGRAGLNGHEDRIVRFERVVIRPADGKCDVVVVDYGRFEDLRPWTLDGIANWYRVSLPSMVGKTFDSDPGSLEFLDLSAPGEAIEIGDVVWLYGPDVPEASRGHYKVVDNSGGTSAIEIDTVLPVAVPLATTMPGNILIMKSHVSPDTGATFRKWKGRLCDETTGAFSNGNPGYSVL